ncbi:MAG: hypothetical protein V4630_18085 [Pseudomonadota bacterium]
MSNATLATAAPSHLVQARITSPVAGRTGRTRWFPCGPTEAEARAAIQKAFPNYTIVSLQTKKAAPVRKSVSILVKHDYITVTAIYATGRVNLTSSFGGKKMSGVGGTKTLWAAFCAFTKVGAPSLLMKKIADLAKDCNSADELAAALNNA